MRKAFKASRLIGLFALLSGFMAFGASAAQAEGIWLESGVAIAGNRSVNAWIDSEFILLTKSGLSKVEILCTQTRLVNANLEIGGLASGKIHLEGCITKLNGSTATKCKPHSPLDAEGLIETGSLDGSLRLRSSAEVFELLGFAGLFVWLQLGTGECAIGNNIPITGEVFIKDAQGEGLVDKTQHLFQESVTLTNLFFGGNRATIDGSAFGFLFSGNTFAGHV